MSKSFPTDEIKWLDPAKFDLDKYDYDNLRGCSLAVDLEYPKKSYRSHKYYLLVSDKLEIKREMLSKC